MNEHQEDLRTELASCLNRHCRENESNTPDFILAEYLTACLAAFDASVNAREAWYGRENEGPARSRNEGTPIIWPTPEPTP